MARRIEEGEKDGTILDTKGHEVESLDVSCDDHTGTR